MFVLQSGCATPWLSMSLSSFFRTGRVPDSIFENQINLSLHSGHEFISEPAVASSDEMALNFWHNSKGRSIFMVSNYVVKQLGKFKIVFM